MKTKIIRRRQRNVFTFSQFGLIRFCRKFQQKLDDLMKDASDAGRPDLETQFASAYADLDACIAEIKISDSENLRNEIRMTCKHAMRMI